MPDDAPNEGRIWVEIQPLAMGSDAPEAFRKLPPGASPVAGFSGSIGAVVQAASEDLQACIRKVADAVSAAVAEGGPQSWTVEFSIEFKGSAAIPVIASGEAKANLKVTLTWKQQ
jgi:hypothetical protein